LATAFPFTAMPDDLPISLISAILLILYLVVLAMTEMGTKLPWKK